MRLDLQNSYRNQHMLMPAGEAGSGGVMASPERNLAILSAEKCCLEAQMRKDERQDKRMGDN